MIFTADMIPELIARTGWTQKEIAETVGASEHQVSKWMKGRGSKKLTARHRKGFIAVCVSNSIDTKDFNKPVEINDDFVDFLAGNTAEQLKGETK